MSGLLGFDTIERAQEDMTEDTASDGADRKSESGRLRDRSVVVSRFFLIFELLAVI